ncbi:MAG: hypothetical protein R6U98_04325 [Pirellulaceae bacterium]
MHGGGVRQFEQMSVGVCVLGARSEESDVATLAKKAESQREAKASGAIDCVAMTIDSRGVHQEAQVQLVRERCPGHLQGERKSGGVFPGEGMMQDPYTLIRPAACDLLQRPEIFR